MLQPRRCSSLILRAILAPRAPLKTSWAIRIDVRPLMPAPLAPLALDLVEHLVGQVGVAVVGGEPAGDRAVGVGVPRRRAILRRLVEHLDRHVVGLLAVGDRVHVVVLVRWPPNRSCWPTTTSRPAWTGPPWRTGRACCAWRRRVPRQECEQVRNQLLYCWRRPLLPLARARRITANGPLGPCSLASVRAMMIRTLAPRLCAARSALTNTQLLKFQVIARILPCLWVCRMARRTLELIACERGTLNETPFSTRNRAGALASRSTPRSLSAATCATDDAIRRRGVGRGPGSEAREDGCHADHRDGHPFGRHSSSPCVADAATGVRGGSPVVGIGCRVGQAWQALIACLNCSLSIRLGTSLICLPVTA